MLSRYVPQAGIVPPHALLTEALYFLFAASMHAEVVESMPASGLFGSPVGGHTRLFGSFEFAAAHLTMHLPRAAPNLLTAADALLSHLKTVLSIARASEAPNI